MRRITVAAGAIAVLLGGAGPAAGKVLRVGVYKGIKGQFTSIQAAVDHARPGDWILVGPGDYKTRSFRAPRSAHDSAAAVLIQTARLRLRGMNRNSVVIDGTTKGPKCNALTADQNFGPKGDSGNPPKGLNGVMVWKATDVWVQNMTDCNFLGGSGDAGNGFWWNGGDGSGKVGAYNFLGSFLTSTSTYYDPNNTQAAAEYGVFSSNWSGGTWNVTYASNFNDSGLYIGACQQVCNQTVNHAWSEFNALGYSGSNSGGRLLVENSEWDHNQDGFDTNSQNGDNPPPQNGSCPAGVSPPVKGAPTCWVFWHNYVHDNNDVNVPTAGLAGGGPAGTGMSLSGGRFDTVMDNRFVNNGAWGTIIVPFPDSGPPCTGGTDSGAVCLYDEWGDALIGNTYTHNGFFGNPTNGDFAQVNTEPGPTDCYYGNKDTSGPLTQTPSNAETMYPKCDGSTVPPTASTSPQSDVFTEEVACDSTLNVSGTGKAPCAPTDSYPRRQRVIMHPLPPASKLETMRNPCLGVPANPWCPAGRQRNAARRA